MLLKRKIIAFFENIFNFKYKCCRHCNRPLNKVNWAPVIIMLKKNKTHKLVNSYLFPIYCINCWLEMPVEEKIKGYLKEKKEHQETETIIKNICIYSNVNPDKYLRKEKLKIRKEKLIKLNERFPS